MPTAHPFIGVVRLARLCVVNGTAIHLAAKEMAELCEAKMESGTSCRH